MTWLSAILEDIEHARGGDASNTEEHPGERMARVIRELVACLEVICQLKNVDLISWSDISPDAKEVINDTTAPSST